MTPRTGGEVGTDHSGMEGTLSGCHDINSGYIIETEKSSCG